jgi:hypothetical protein
MIKPYLVFMSGPGEQENIHELVEPIKPYVRGICALVHDADSFDEGAKYILGVNNELGAGNVIFGPYVGDHSLSRNRIFRECNIQESDFLLIIDTLERVGNKFALNLDRWCKYMEDNNIDIIRYHVKPYLVRYREDLIYIGTPHESLVILSDRESLKQIDLAYDPAFQNESEVRVNMRPIKRANQPKHFVTHYLRYLLQPNSNQNWLGLEHHGDKYTLEKKEAIRKGLVRFLAKNLYPRTANGVLEAMVRVGPKGEMKEFINGHKILNDFYRLKVLGDEDVFDSHAEKDWDNMPKF